MRFKRKIELSLFLYSEHWSVLFCILLTFINDHFLKQSAFSGELTGKLSDFAGLYFAPFILFDLLRVLNIKLKQANRAFLLILFLVGGGFFLLQTSEVAVYWYEVVHQWFGIHVEVTMDQTDLFALGSLLLAYLGFRSMEKDRGDYEIKNECVARCLLVGRNTAGRDW